MKDEISSNEPEQLIIENNRVYLDWANTVLA